MQRRSFLSAILIGGAAPAIVKAENVMKLWVPKQEIVTTGYMQLSENYAANLAASIDATHDYYIERVASGLASPRQEGRYMVYDLTPEIGLGERLKWPFKPEEAHIPPGWALYSEEHVNTRPPWDQWTEDAEGWKRKAYSWKKQA